MIDRSTGVAAVALLLLAGYAAAASGAVESPAWRASLALAGLLLLPGIALALALVPRYQVLDPSFVACAAGLGLAVDAAAILVAHAAGQSFFFGAWLPVAGAAAVFVAYGLRRPREVSAEAAARSGSRTHLFLWPLVAIAAWIGAVGPPLGVHSDSLAHVAMLRRAALTGSAFPLDTFYADAGAAGADPRAGILHPVLALVVRVTDVDPVVAWRWGSVVLAPFLLLAIYALARAIAGPPGPAVACAAIALVVHGGGQPFVAWREAVYPARVAEALGLLALASAFHFLRGSGARRAALAAGLAFAAVATHVFAAVALGVALLLTLLGIGLHALTRAGRSGRWPTRLLVRKTLVVAGVAALVTAPYLWWRYRSAYAPADPIHLEPQGLLYWGSERLFSVSPESVWSWLGWPALLLPLVALWLWRERERGPGYVYLALACLALPLLVLHPLLLPPLHDRLGYLVSRLVACVPMSVALGLAIWTAARAWHAGESAAAQWVLAAAIAVGLAQGWAAWSAVRRPLSPVEIADAGAEARLTPAMARLREEATGPLVLASDPATSYLLPAYTGHFVTAVMPQHASPNDPRGEARIVRARDILLPRVSPAETERQLAESGADALLLDLAPSEPLVAGPWTRNPLYSSAVLHKFEARPDRFRIEPLAEGVLLVWPRGNPGFDSTLAAAEPRDTARESAADGGRSPFQIALAVRHEETRVTPAVARPGDSVRVETGWRRVAPLPPGLYVVEASLSLRRPSDPLYRPWYGRVYRRVSEVWTGMPRHAESNHVPADGMWPPETWPAGQVVWESYPFPIPIDLAPGTYDLRLRFERVAHHPNRRIEDFWREDETVWGPAVARLEVRGGEAGDSP